jgi:hypothetical protein
MKKGTLAMLALLLLLNTGCSTWVTVGRVVNEAVQFVASVDHFVNILPGNN